MNGQREALEQWLAEGLAAVRRRPGWYVAGTTAAALGLEGEDWRRWAAHPAAVWAWEEADGLTVGLGRAWIRRVPWGQDPWPLLAAAVRELARVPGLPPQLRLGGGVAFQPAAAPGPDWAAWGAAALTLPLLTITARRGQPARLTLVLPPAASATGRLAAQELPRLARGPLPAAPEAVRVVAESGTGPAAWTQRVERARAAIRAGELDKVVLARSRTLTFERGLGVAEVWDRLGDRAGEATLFLLADPGGGPARFVGASPELLVRTRAGRVETMCVAGSAPPEADPVRALLASPKNRGEHAWVREHILARLAPWCTAVEAPAEPEVVRRSYIQHLVTPVQGRLRPGAGLLEVAGALHPTPAVGGAPAEAALAWLAREEGLERGWYAGAVGYVDLVGQGAFWVGLRSALLQGRQAVLYAGCGIVADSDPAAEYRESGWKMRPMLEALGTEAAAWRMQA
ncbi:MAG: isochorismate synthase [Firmicutes bacterium]|nr:isochorismate synthase [Bacillota bacterium]